MIRSCSAVGWMLAAASNLLMGCIDRAADHSGESPRTTRAALREKTGDALRRGALALHTYGCGACHRIPGIAGADGVVGPPLVNMRQRVYIGRGVPNTSANMIRWIRAPQAMAPGSAMPDMQVSAADATAMAAYLHRPK